MATLAVLGTPELLELILSQLSQHELFSARTVSIEWSGIVDASVKLGRAMWTYPVPESGVWIQEPLRANRHAPCQAPTYDSRILAVVPRESSILRDPVLPRITPVRFNPVLIQRTSPMPLDYRAANRDHPRFLMPLDRLRKPYYQTCDDMYLTQPPCKAVDLAIVIQPSETQFYYGDKDRPTLITSVRHIVQHDGVRLKHVTDHVKDWSPEANITGLGLSLPQVVEASEHSRAEINARTRVWETRKAQRPSVPLSQGTHTPFSAALTSRIHRRAVLRAGDRSDSESEGSDGSHMD